MKAISVTGVSSSGKTTVCEQLIQGLTSRGYRVGSVKEIHYEAFEIDPNPQANTHRHYRAGAQLVTARAAAETDILYKRRLSIDEILIHYRDFDYVVMEGVCDADVPNIVTAHTTEDLQLKLNPLTCMISGVIANTGISTWQHYPVIHAIEKSDELIRQALDAMTKPYVSGNSSVGKR